MHPKVVDFQKIGYLFIKVCIDALAGGGATSRPGYFYLFGENRDWNSRDNLKIFGKVRKFWAARSKQ